MPCITIVTHDGIPAGAPDDLALAAAIETRGADVRFAVWSDPAVDWAATPLAVIRSTWDYHLRPADWFAWLDRAAPLTRLVNPAPLVRWNSDKAYLLDLQRAGATIIPTLLIDEEGTDIASACAARGWDDVVVKPTIGASSNGARRFRDGEIAKAANGHARALLANGRALLQPYQRAIETERERSLVFVDGGFSHAFSKPGFHNAVTGEALRTHRPDAAEMALAQTVLAALPEPAVIARIDMLPAASGPLLMEAELIEPQLGFHLHPEGAGLVAETLVRIADNPA